MSVNDLAMGILLMEMLNADRNTIKVDCKCGKQMEKRIIKQEFQVFVCDGCRKRLRCNDIVYQCPKLGNSFIHPDGFDYCEECARRVSKLQKEEEEQPQPPPPPPQQQQQPQRLLLFRRDSNENNNDSKTEELEQKKIKNCKNR